MLRWDDCVRRDERIAGEKKVGRRKETAGGKDYQMIRWRSWGQHLKHIDKGKKSKRWSILCMYYTEVWVPIGCSTVLVVDRDR